MTRRATAFLAGCAIAAALAAPVIASAQAPDVQVQVPPPAERDGARVLGRLGLGTFRRVQFELGGNEAAIPVDAVGLRYWFPGHGPGAVRAWGLDVGVAFAYQRDTAEGAGAPKATRTSIAGGVHGGVPLVLAQLPHANFEVVPELDVVLLGGDRDGAHLSGFALNAGARAGFEVFFGFIGVSDLSLEASIGFGVSHVSAKLDGGGATASRSTTFVGFQKLDDPWDIFRSTVAARYYF